MNKINLGCGPGGVDGWTNYDWGLLPLVNKFPKWLVFLVKIGALNRNYITNWPKFRLFDIRKRFNEKNNSTDVVYCSQVLEHFEKWEALKISQEVYRILKKGGIYRVSVPDINLLIERFEKNGNTDQLAQAIWGFDKQIEPKSRLQRMARLFIRDHQWLYDVNSMKILLGKAGFRRISVCAFKKGNCPDLDKLDLEDHRSSSLYLEAIK